MWHKKQSPFSTLICFTSLFFTVRKNEFDLEVKQGLPATPCTGQRGWIRGSLLFHSRERFHVDVYTNQNWRTELQMTEKIGQQSPLALLH